MTHHDSGHFSTKHPDGTSVPPALQQAVRDRLADKEITCHAAFAICEALHVTAREVGIAIDLQEGRIRKCQLGLFGYPQGKSVKAAEKVGPELRAAIEAATVNGRVTCMDAWRIADTAKIARLAVANACEALKIKIKACQLGAF